MKYQLEPSLAIFDDGGFTTVPGWVIIYNFDINTSEYINATYQYLPARVGIPAYSCLDAPKSVKKDKAIVRSGDRWIYPNDFRGKQVYSIETGIESIITEIGDIPLDYTLIKPASQFDTWNGEQWVLDKNKQSEYFIQKATIRKNQLIDEATNQISYLQDAVDSQIATELEIKSLADWKKYRVLLNRINTDLAPDITFPEKPNK